MKKKVIMVLMVAIMFCVLNNVYAASSLSVSSASVTAGETFTVTAKVWNVGAWQMYVNVTGPATFVSGNISDPNGSIEDGSNGSRTLVSTYKVTGKGDITVAFTGNATDENVNKEYININKTVVGKAKVVTSNTQTSTTTQTTTKTPTTPKKSSEARLNAITVDVEGLNPSFNKDKTSYNLDVDGTVNKLNMTVSLKNNKATYKITGNKDFKVGENIVKIKVTAENKKTTKTYTIKVNKAPDLTLSSLTIGNAELTKEFDPAVLEYTLKDIGENITKLDINAATTSEAATVKIAGNDSLVSGQNIIKIVVSDESGKYTRVYTLNVNKVGAVPVISENIEEEKIVEQNSLIEEINSFLDIKDERVKQNIAIVALYLLALVEFIQVVYLYKQLKTANPDYDKIIRRGQKDKSSEPTRRRALDIENNIETQSGVDLEDNNK